MDKPFSWGSPESFPDDGVSFHSVGLEEFLGKVGHHLRIVSLAAEHVEISGIRLVGKMGRDQGGLDELSHGVSGYPLILAKMNYLGFPIAFHLNEVTELNHKPSNGFSVSNDLRITMVKVNGSKNPPG
jgi:hypothetical protein